MTVHTERDVELLQRGLERRARNSLREHWQAYAFEGTVLAALGVAAVIVPSIAGLAIDIFIGWLLFIAGVIGLVARLSRPDTPAFWTGLLLAVITTVLGGLFALWPVQGVVTLTMALTAFFIAHGIGMLALAVSVRAETGRWLLLLLSALVDFVLAALVLSQWPQAASWLLGIYVGINLIFSGLGLVFAALGARSEASG